MKYLALVSLFTGFLISCSSDDQVDRTRILPAPTQLAPNVEEGSDAGNARETWIEYIHNPSGDVNWRAIELANRRATVSRLAKFQHNLQARGANQDSIAPGINGTWHERGSTNQAGSLLATAYDAAADKIYSISAGGTLWAGPSDGSNWKVLNQEFQFDDKALLLIDLPSGGQRILSSIERQPAYSDDDGATWTVSSSVSPKINGWGYTRDFVLVDNASAPLIYAVTSEGYWENNFLIFSSNLGETWSPVPTSTDLGNLANDVDLQADPRGGTPFILVKNGGLFSVSPVRLTPLGTVPSTLDRVRLTAAFGSDTLHLFTYDEDLTVYHSADSGSTWTIRGILPKSPWDVGIYANPTNPNQLIMGEVEAFVSSNGGRGWVRVNAWGAYYSDVEGSLHADMMTFNTFVKTDGSTFTISANHGGLNRSEDWFNRSRNIGMENLNVGQFYSVTSHNAHPEYIFGGTQDQGFQRGYGDSTEQIPMDQVISGDYGHLTFTHNGSELWMMYPGTAVSVYDAPTGRGYADWLTIDSQNETVWLAPMARHPDKQKNSIIAAGGSTTDDAPGSFLLDFSLDRGTRTILATQQDFDFFDEVGGAISAIEVSPLSNSRIYVATENGRFLKSDNTGDTWEQTINFLPTGHYLYGQAIVASPTEANTVWLAGNGYSGPGVWRSTDAGQNFSPEVDGLPSTMVFELAAHPEGNWIYAATEAGPYALNVEERKWYPLAVPGVPSQTYWSVDYVELDSIVRFATYGRGIWDLKLRTVASPPDTIVSSTTLAQAFEVRIAPNPATTSLSIFSDVQLLNANLVDVAGKVIRQFALKELTSPLNVADLPRGQYYLQLQSRKGTVTKGIILR